MDDPAPVSDPPAAYTVLAHKNRTQYSRQPFRAHYQRPDARRWEERGHVREVLRVRPREVRLYEDVTVYLMGYLAGRDGTLLRETVPALHKGREVYQDIALTEPPQRDNLPVHDGRVILADGQGRGNYGHWLIDYLPRLKWARKISPGTPLLVRKNHPSWLPALVATIGIGADELVTYRPNRGIVCREVVVPTFWGTMGHQVRHPHVVRIADTIRAALGVPTPTGTGERLFLGRDDAHVRRLREESDLLAALEPEGFRKVNAGFMGFAEQAELFGRADTVVAITGAALTNLIFCKPGTLIINVSADTMPSFFFWDLASHAGCRFATYYGEPVGSGTPGGVKDDIAIDVATFMDFYRSVRADA